MPTLLTMSRKYELAGSVQARALRAAPAEHRGHPIAFFVALLLLAAASAYAALAVLLRIDSLFLPGNEWVLPGRLARLPGLDSSAPLDALSNDRINILVMGVDRRPHHDPELDGPPRADSIYIVSVDPLLKTGSVLALPRDLYVEVPNPQGGAGVWDTRINTAYHYGELYEYPGGGTALAKKTIEHNFKVPIHYYAVIDWVAFADVIDELGGIEITVPETLRGVEAYNVRDGNSFPITIRSGRGPMDSITALAYSRYRDGPDGDFGRIHRQQQVMTAVMEKALAAGWLGRAPAMYGKFDKAVDTDLPAIKLPGLAALAKQIGLDRVQMLSLAGEEGENVVRRITPQGEDVLVPDWDLIGPVLAAAVPDRRLQDEGAVVKLVSATGAGDLASRSATTLAHYGIPSGYLLAYDNERVERRATTTVTVYGDKEYTAQRIAFLLGVPRAPIQRGDETTRLAGEPDVVVMLGTDVKLPDDSRYRSFVPR